MREPKRGWGRLPSEATAEIEAAMTAFFQRGWMDETEDLGGPGYLARMALRLAVKKQANHLRVPFIRVYQADFWQWAGDKSIEISIPVLKSTMPLIGAWKLLEGPNTTHWGRPPPGDQTRFMFRHENIHIATELLRNSLAADKVRAMGKRFYQDAT